MKAIANYTNTEGFKKLDREWEIKIYKAYIIAKHSCNSTNDNVFYHENSEEYYEEKLYIRRQCYWCKKPFPDKYVTLVNLLRLDI